MHAEIRSFEWSDIESGRDGQDTSLVVIVAGPTDGPGEETFQATVCTTAALARLVSKDGVVLGRHFIFVDSIDTGRVEDFVRACVRGISGATWTEVAAGESSAFDIRSSHGQ